jgi:hypothetical protein
MRWVFAALLLISTTARAGEDTADAEHELQAGDEAFKAGKYDAAIVHFDAARRLAPDRSAPYRYLGLSYAALGRCADAVPMLEEYARRKKDPSSDAVKELDKCRAFLLEEKQRKAAREVEDSRRRAQVAAEEQQRQQSLEAEARRQHEALDSAEKAQAAAAEKLKKEREDRVTHELSRERIDVCDPTTNPNSGLGPNDWWFCQHGGAMTENDFIRRYEHLTRSREARWALKMRNKATIIVSAILGAGGVAMAAWGLSRVTRPCDPAGDMMNDACLTGGAFDPNKSTVDLLPMLIGIGGAMIWLCTTAVVAASRFDGLPTEHHLTRDLAASLTAKYNAALEANIRDGKPATAPPPAPPRASVTPYFGGLSAGVFGRF